MLNDFLTPLEESIVNYIDGLPLSSIGKKLLINDESLDLSKIDTVSYTHLTLPTILLV